MRARWWMAALLCLALALFAACGGGDDDDDDNGGTDGGNTATATKAPDGETDGAADEPTDRPTDKPAKTPGGNNGGGAAVDDACELLTPDDVAAVVGQDMEDGVSTDVGSEKPQCEWDASDPSAAVAIYLYVLQGTGAESDYEIFDANSEQLDGLGEKAHWVENLGVLEVFTGDANVSLQIVDLSAGADQRAIGLALAEKVLDNLP